MLSDVEKGNNFMLTRLTPVATLFQKLVPMPILCKMLCVTEMSGLSYFANQIQF